MSMVQNLADVNPSPSGIGGIKMLLKANEAATATSFSDSSDTGLVLPTAAITDNGDGSLVINTGLDAAVTTGTIPSPGASATFAFFALFQRKGSFGTVTIGDETSGQGISLLIAAAGNSVVKNASGSKSLNAVNSANPVKMLIVDNGTNLQLYTGAIGTYLAQSGANVARGGDLTAVDNEVTICDAVSGGINFWGAMYCIFGSTLPSDIVAAADRTMEQWYLDNKTYYPRINEMS